MAAWLATAVPLIPEVIRLAKPFFSRKPQEALPDLVTSIRELQDASLQNADAITKNADALATFAGNTQKSVELLQCTVTQLHKELKMVRSIALVAVTAAVLAFFLAAVALAST